MGLTSTAALEAEPASRSAPDIAGMRRLAKEAAQEFAETLSLLPRGEQIAIAEALIGKFGEVLKKVSPKAAKAFDPSQPRDQDGKWTATGMASAAAGMAARGAGAVGKLALHAAREALSTVTLVPSSKQAVGDALQSWWKRVMSDDSTTHIEAIQEGAGRLMVTIILGSMMVVLAQSVLGGAAGAVGAAVGQALRFALGKRDIAKTADIGEKLMLLVAELRDLDGNGQHSPAKARTLLTQLSHAQLMDGPADDLLRAVVDFGQTALHLREQVVKAFNPSQPRDARGRWTSGGSAAAGPIGDVKAKVNAALDGIATGSKTAKEAAATIKEVAAATKKGVLERAAEWLNTFEDDDLENALDITFQVAIIVGIALYAYFVGFPIPADMRSLFGR